MMEPNQKPTEEVEKRESPRVSTKIEIKFGDSGAFIKSYMLNVSKGGLFIRTEQPFDLDTVIFLKFFLPDDTDPIEAEGKVVWSNPKGGKGYFPRGMGIQFTRMKPEYAEKIKKFIEKYQTQIETHAIF